MIRVGVNLLWLRPGVVGGSEQFLVRLLDGVGRRAQVDVELRLYVLPEFVEAHPQLAETFPTVVAPIEGATPARRVLCEQRWLPGRLRGDGLDVSFHAGGTMPLRPGPRPVLLIHDVQYLDHPEWFPFVKRSYLRFQVPRSVEAAALVAAPSHHAVDRLVEAFGVDPARTAVLPHGIDPPAIEPVVPQQLDAPVVLYPAITYPHKRHDLLVRAAAQMTSPAKVVLVGGESSAEDDVRRLIDDLGVGERVVRTGRVSDDELERWWQSAAVLAWPSAYEGFGAPLVEAMTRGVPVVASNHTAVPEVVGSGGVIVDSDDPAVWAARLDDALRPERAEELRSAGRTRATAFGVDRAVDRLLEIFHRAAN